MTDREQVIGRILETQRQLRRRLTEQGAHPLLDVQLTMSQLKVMIVLGRLGATSGQDLARRTGFSLATLTGVVDRLVVQDLVSRREDPSDRRVRRLELTPAGTELIDRLIAAGEEQQHRMLDRLEDDGLDLVARAFDLLLDATAADSMEPGPLPR
ncbi:MAG TPA: MarR family transcriptional regulator [Actinoplanes sp.]